MRLIHYSDKPLKSIRPAKQPSEPTDKPNGLWVSVGAAWKEWCEEEHYNLSRVAIETELEIVEESRLLVLNTAPSIFDFTKKFWATPEWAACREYIVTRYIDWSKVSSLWSGIIVDPYVWECRLNPSCEWYYGWDCASGCIWNPSAIRRLENERNLEISA